jgi:nitroreductase
MHMADKAIVALKDVADQLEMVDEAWDIFYNLTTGEFDAYSAQYADSDTESGKFESDEWIPLPSYRDIDEYSIRIEFAETVRDPIKQEPLLVALEGKGAFRDALIRTDLEEKWYAFRGRAFMKVARAWCKENDIPFSSKTASAATAADSASKEPDARKAVVENILHRRSVRSYRPEQVPDDALRTILAAGQSAPYVSPDSRHFAVVRNAETLQALGEAAKEAARASDLPHLRQLGGDPDFDGSYGAPTVVVVSGNADTVQYEGVCAASVENMLLAAEALGFGACWVYFVIFAFDSPQGPALRQALSIPEGYRPCAAVLLGYSDEKANANDARYKNEIAWIR